MPHRDAAESLTSHPAAVRAAIVRSIVRVVRPHSAASFGIPGQASPVALSACDAITSSTNRSVDVRRAEARTARTAAKKPIAVGVDAVELDGVDVLLVLELGVR